MKKFLFALTVVLLVSGLNAESFLCEQVIPENSIFCVFGKARFCEDSYYKFRNKVAGMTDEIALAFINLTT